MGKFCCVVGCSQRSERDKNTRFFNVPKVIHHQGEQTKDLSKRRREKWLSNINRASVTSGDVKNPMVCSLHFHKGQPAGVYDKMHPDWAPTVAMGQGHSSTTHSINDCCLGRFNRCIERTKRKCMDNTTSTDNITQRGNDGMAIIPPGEQSENLERHIDPAKNSDEDQEDASIPASKSVAREIQTDMTIVDIDLLTYRPTQNLSQENFASEAFFQVAKLLY